MVESLISLNSVELLKINWRLQEHAAMQRVVGPQTVAEPTLMPRASGEGNCASR